MSPRCTKGNARYFNLGFILSDIVAKLPRSCKERQFSINPVDIGTVVTDQTYLPVTAWLFNLGKCFIFIDIVAVACSHCSSATIG